MTITYTLEVSRARFWGFPKLLLRWKGSIYRLMYREMLAFLMAYYCMALAYRYGMEAGAQRQFERIAVYCRDFTSVVPITFVMGFYVAFVMGRWWQQYMAIPWPDRTVMQISALITGATERPRLIRRALARYLNLLLVFTFQNTSTVIKKMFPTLRHLVDTGMMTEEELTVIEEIKAPHGKWWVPAQWACQLIVRARNENLIRDDYNMQVLIRELQDYRGLCGLLWSYDWISVPLVYTQVVTIAVYSFFIACLFGRQFLFFTPLNAMSEPADGALSQTVDGHVMDFYFPLFTIFQFFFYVGWLKVAESMLCPFGEDDDDFDLGWIVGRNLHVCYSIVDTLHDKIPVLVKDKFWNTDDPSLPENDGKTPPDAYYGSASAVTVNESEKTTANNNNNNEDADWEEEKAQESSPINTPNPNKKVAFLPLTSLFSCHRFASPNSTLPITEVQLESPVDMAPTIGYIPSPECLTAHDLESGSGHKTHLANGLEQMISGDLQLRQYGIALTEPCLDESKTDDVEEEPRSIDTVCDFHGSTSLLVPPPEK